MGSPEFNLKNYFQKLDDLDPIKTIGSVKRAVGLVVESLGPPVSIGELCEISKGRTERSEHPGGSCRVQRQLCHFHASFQSPWRETGRQSYLPKKKGLCAGINRASGQSCQCHGRAY